MVLVSHSTLALHFDSLGGDRSGNFMVPRTHLQHKEIYDLAIYFQYMRVNISDSFFNVIS